MDLLISAGELSGLLDGPASLRPVVLDVRWRLGGPPGHGEYLTGHVPGAVYVALDTELAAHGRPEDGRHPLPNLDALQEAARRWGLRDGASVVVYDANGNLAAARAWWLLRWAGVEDVRLLDGGLPAWVAQGGELAGNDVVASPGDVVLRADSMPRLVAEDVMELARTGVLLDARAPERYRGETEPMDPKAGHVPGAVNAPTTENLQSDGTFRAPADLRERFEAVGVREGVPVGVYCGSGVTAAHEIVALALAGFEAQLYAGSWSQWSNRDLPVATGEEP